jgi:hypothetical protein
MERLAAHLIRVSFSKEGMDYLSDDPVVGELAFKVFEHTVGRTYMMTIVEKIHVTDVRDVGDITHKTAELAAIFEAGKRLALG